MPLLSLIINLMHPWLKKKILTDPIFNFSPHYESITITMNSHNVLFPTIPNDTTMKMPYLPFPVC